MDEQVGRLINFRAIKSSMKIPESDLAQIFFGKMKSFQVEREKCLAENHFFPRNVKKSQMLYFFKNLLKKIIEVFSISMRTSLV